MKNKFKVGDRVVYRGHAFINYIGKVGTVIGVEDRLDNIYSVKFEANRTVDIFVNNMRPLLSDRLIDEFKREKQV